MWCMREALCVSHNSKEGWADESSSGVGLGSIADGRS